MRVFTTEDLRKIIQKNSDYVKGVAGGVRADLHGADLHGANLRGADLHGADLQGANLTVADLHGANLTGANLTVAILTGANLHNANLSSANLADANLHGANLHGANLHGANLHNANLTGANLTGADLHGANLTVANLTVANLHNANLSSAYLTDANIATAFIDEKEQQRKGTILKKKIKGYKKLSDGSVCVLSIPKGAIVFSINGSKCRTNRASVLEGGGASSHDRDFVYKKGEKYEISDFNLAYNIECASGIHFFKTREEAVDYQG